MDNLTLMSAITFSTMKNPMKKSIISLLLILVMCFGISASAQIDSRNRKPETVVSDNLAQLPAQSGESYDKIMSELAGTGSKGIELLVNMLRPAEEADNSRAEYAIDGIVNYVSAPGREALRRPVHDALAEALARVDDVSNKAFVLSQLNKITVPSDFSLYKGLLADKNLASYAASGLCTMPDIDLQLTELIDNASAPSAELAYIAYYRQLPGVESVLLSWAVSGDKAVSEAALNALSVCGSAASLKTLKTAAPDAYLQLLARLGTDKAAVREAKELIKNKNNEAMRCAGLRLLLVSEPAKAAENIVKALKDGSAQYRHTALVNAIPAAGEGIVSVIAANYSKLPENSKIDVMRWLGDIHTSAQIDLVTSAVASSNSTLAVAAVEAASKIGTPRALDAIIPLLGTDGELSHAAAKALLTFNGNISQGVTECLKSDNPVTLKAALSLASARHIHSAWNAVVALTQSSLSGVADEAYKALDGVASAANLSELSGMLQAAAPSTVPMIQRAMLSALAPESPSAQYDTVSRLMSLAKNPSLYYPMLAQAGTPDAVEALVGGFEGNSHSAALQALLMVENPHARDTIFSLASKSSGAERDALLGRWLTLVNNSGLTPAQAYTAYSRALDLNPGEPVKKELISSLARCPVFPAAICAAAYFGDKHDAYAAANAFAEILKSDEHLRQGDTLRDAANGALKVFGAEKAKGDADAGYAADMLRGLLDNWTTVGGYRPAGADGSADVSAPAVTVGKNLENFELCFDWLGEGDAVVTLRSMPLVLLSAANGITLAGSDVVVPASRGWNNIYVKMTDDRFFLDVNGEAVAVNQVINRIPGTDKTAPAEGKVSIVSDGGNGLALRALYVNELPATPVCTLSPDETEQGFELLFDGRSLENFHGNMSNYVPQDGNIYVTAQYGGHGNLYTKKNYSDFIFRFEFFFDEPAVNNGIGIRTGRDVTGVDAAYEGMEIQILDHDDPVYQGYNYNFTGLHPYQQHGGVYGIAVPKHIDFGTIRQWHTEEIKAVGDRITVTVDGEVVTDVNIREITQGHNVAPDGSNNNPYTLDHNNHPGLYNKEGYISFCGHGPGLKFRNIRVLDLSKKK